MEREEDLPPQLRAARPYAGREHEVPPPVAPRHPTRKLDRNAAPWLIAACTLVLIAAFLLLLIRERNLSARLARFEGPRATTAIPEGDYGRYAPLPGVSMPDFALRSVRGYEVSSEPTSFGTVVECRLFKADDSGLPLFSVEESYFRNRDGQAVLLSGRYVPFADELAGIDAPGVRTPFGEAHSFAVLPIINNPPEQHAAMLTWLEDHWSKGGEVEFGGVHYRLEFDGGTRRLYMRMAGQEIIPAIPNRPLNFNERNAPRHY